MSDSGAAEGRTLHHEFCGREKNPHTLARVYITGELRAVDVFEMAATGRGMDRKKHTYTLEEGTIRRRPSGPVGAAVSEDLGDFDALQVTATCLCGVHTTIDVAALLRGKLTPRYPVRPETETGVSYDRRR